MERKYFSVTYAVNHRNMNNTYAAGVAVDIYPKDAATYRHFKLQDAVKKAHFSLFGEIISSYDVILRCVVDLTV